MKSEPYSRSLTLLCALVATAVFTWQASAQEFGYHDPVGPSDWCGLSTDNVACCGGGGQQSPIDIVSSAVQSERKLSALRLHLAGATTLDVENNGHTVQANVPTGVGTLELNGTVYNLLQFHFHTPSEHTVNGQHAPIEMHMVHKTPDGSQTAVVGVFIVPGRENKELQKIWSNLPDEEGEEIEVAGFGLHGIVPGQKATFRYPGSLTTPPCSEGVSWNIFSTPITMSQAQIEQFQTVFSGEDFPSGNARPTQPLGNRTIKTDAKK